MRAKGAAARLGSRPALGRLAVRRDGARQKKRTASLLDTTSSDPASATTNLTIA
jgi:hypothetical protein